jgi:hypothetical protein
MDTRQQSSQDFAAAWPIALRALWSKPALAIGAVLLLAFATLVAGHVYELVLGLLRQSLLGEVPPMMARMVQRGLTLLAACAMCVLAGQLAAKIMAQSAQQPRRLLHLAVIWLVVLLAPYLIGLPARTMVATYTLETQALPLLSALACFAAIKAGLAAALLFRLRHSSARAVEAPRASQDIVPLFLRHFPIFAVLMALQAVVDLGLWDGDQPYWEIVYDVAFIADALAALLATMLVLAAVFD